MILETFRECLRDVFDLPGLRSLLADVESRAITVHAVESTTPSPFAASLLFSYVGNFIYDADAPLAERRAQTLALDHAQLRELLGDAQLRELLDPDVVDEASLELQRLGGHLPARDEDEVHDLLRVLGHLDVDEILERTQAQAEDVKRWLTRLLDARRIIELQVAGKPALVAAEDAGRYRDALGAAPPSGLPAAFLDSVDDPIADLVSRYARTHVPFVPADVAARLGLGIAPVRQALERLAERDRVIEGEFLPAGHGREWVDTGVLRTIKRRSLARLRKEVEPVDPTLLAGFAPRWHGLDRPRRGLDALLDVIEQIQGLPLPASSLEQHILVARLPEYQTRDLDELCAAGEIVWRGIDSLGTHDGRIALYLADKVQLLSPEPIPVEGEVAAKIRGLIAERGALFFDEMVRDVGGFPADVLKVLWELVWSGEVTNDTLAPLRSLARGDARRRKRGRPGRGNFRSRRELGPPGSEGRWSLLHGPYTGASSATEVKAALTHQLLERHGVMTRESISIEWLSGGFAGVYPVLKTMEEAGKIRRGYFVAGLGAAQFAVSGAEGRLREARGRDDDSEVFVMAATDPANVYGAAVSWPHREAETGKPARAAGARVVVVDGVLVAWLNKAFDSVLTWRPSDSEESTRAFDQVLAQALTRCAQNGSITINKIDGVSILEIDAPLLTALGDAGFTPSGQGLMYRTEGHGTAMSRRRGLPRRAGTVSVETDESADVNESADIEESDDA